MIRRGAIGGRGHALAVTYAVGIVLDLIACVVFAVLPHAWGVVAVTVALFPIAAILISKKKRARGVRESNPAQRIVMVLSLSAAAGTLVYFGYLRLRTDEIQQFAAFGIAKQITLPLMYVTFFVALIWPYRAARMTRTGGTPAWWWVMLISLILSAFSSAIVRVQEFSLLDYLQGIALVGGALLIAYIGFFAAGWSRKAKSSLVALLIVVSVLAIAERSTSMTPFIGVLVPTVFAMFYLSFRGPGRGLAPFMVGVALAAGLAYVLKSGTTEISLAVVAEIAAACGVLVILLIPRTFRGVFVLAGSIAGAYAVVHMGVLPLFFGDASFADVTLAQRGYEAATVNEAIFSTPVTTLFGMGPGGVVDLSNSPDAQTLLAAGRTLSAVDGVHLLSAWIMLKLGMLGLLAIGIVAVAVVQRSWAVLSAKRVDTFDAVLLFYVLAGVAMAVPAATNLFANPLPFLFLAIITARHTANRSDPNSLESPAMKNIVRFSPGRVSRLRSN